MLNIIYSKKIEKNLLVGVYFLTTFYAIHLISMILSFSWSVSFGLFLALTLPLAILLIYLHKKNRFVSFLEPLFAIGSSLSVLFAIFLIIFSLYTNKLYEESNTLLEESNSSIKNIYQDIEDNIERIEGSKLEVEETTDRAEIRELNNNIRRLEKEQNKSYVAYEEQNKKNRLIFEEWIKNKDTLRLYHEVILILLLCFGMLYPPFLMVHFANIRNK